METATGYQRSQQHLNPIVYQHVVKFGSDNLADNYKRCYAPATITMMGNSLCEMALAESERI